MRTDLWGWARRALAGGVVAAGMLGLGPASAVAASLRVLPPSGVYAAPQRLDIVVLLEDLGAAAVVGGQVFFDGQDVTGALASCAVAEPVGTGVALRCAGVPAGALGLGHHLLAVKVILTGGTTLEGGAIWQVLRVDP